MTVDTEQASRTRAPSWRPSGGGDPVPPSRRANVDPPRQRRPALAALALLLVVGGALLAGLMAVRMDSRTSYLAASRDIAPGTAITAADLREVSVAADGLNLITAEQADQILTGSVYARVPISADSLVDQSMLTNEAPVADGRAIVSVPLNPVLTPASSLDGGDLVQVVRVGGEQGNGQAKELTQALVIDVTQASTGDLQSSTTGSVTLLVPDSAAADVVDASGANVAGLVLLQRGQPLDVDLEVGE